MSIGQEKRQALVRLLETDHLLGARQVPLRLPAARPAGTGMSAGRRTARPVDRAPKGHPEDNHARVVRLDMPAEEVARREQALQKIDAQVKVCVKCTLAETRTKTVFGQGDARTRLVFVGEAPGYDEDQQGFAFVGRAGQLLTKMIEAMGLKREWVFICNILKCRPPQNRNPAPNEIQSCWPYLDQQLRTIEPEVIVALGKPAAQTLLRTSESIGRLRGQWHDYHTSGMPGVGQPTPLMPTYHPAYLLRNPPDKAKAWADLKQVMARLDLAMPPR